MKSGDPLVELFQNVVDGLFRNSSSSGANFAAFFDELADRSGCANGPSLPVSPLYLSDAREVLSGQMRERLNIAEMAARLGYSSGHFSRAFKSTFFMTPHAWRLTARVEIAKRRLREGATVEQAAHEAGFLNLSHFSRQYRARTGITARTYATQFARELDGLSN